MIPITAQTKFETDSVASSPNPFINELHENENHSEFSDILAAIMKSNELDSSNRDSESSQTSDSEQSRFGAVNNEGESSVQLTVNVELESSVQMSINSKTAGLEQFEISEEEPNLQFGSFDNELDPSAWLAANNGQITINNEQLTVNNEFAMDLQNEGLESIGTLAEHSDLFIRDQSDQDTSARLEKSKAQNIEKPVLGNELVSIDKESEELLAAEKAVKNTQGGNKSSETLSRTEVASVNSSDKNSDKENAFSRNDQEEKQGRLDEIRGRSRRDRISFDIRDQRTGGSGTEVSASRSFSSVDAAASRMGDGAVKDITLDLRLPDYNNAGQNAQTTWEVKASSAFENMLARELHQNFNGDIVRHASVALRDSGESIIKLNLKPDVLGNVKIRLEMTDNKVTGVILVESEEALNAFRKEIAALEQAFKEAGFSDAALDLSLANDSNKAFAESDEKNLTARAASLNYEDSLRESGEIGTGAIDIFGQKTGSLNMFA